MFERIVVGFDGSPSAIVALHTAVELAEASGGKVYAVCAGQHPGAEAQATRQLLGAEGQAVRQRVPKEFRAAFDPYSSLHETLDEAAELLREAGARGETVAVEGHAVDAILDVADDVDADLIVVGSRGLSHAKRLFMGSVSTRLAHHTGRSILIMHAGEQGAR